jgi:hypothetical protein
MHLKEMDWVNLAQNRLHWQAIVNTEIKVRAPYEAGYFLTS